MKKHYDGLELFSINLDTDVTNGSQPPPSPCVAMIQLKMENGICVSDSSQQQVEYVGDQG